MKYIPTYLIIILLICLGGCDFLSYDETTGYKKSEIFENFDRTKKFLNHIYSRVPNGFNSVGGAMRTSGSDNAEEGNSFSSVQRFNDGTWSEVQHVDAMWDHLYGGIQAVNKFLKEFDIENFDDLKYNDNYEQLMEQAKLFRPQARFLRAYFYFLLIKRYGHVPLITTVLSPEEANNVVPSSYEEITTFILSECNAVIKKLPHSYTTVPKQETGRATKGAARTLKAKALLYAASPLHNPSHKKTKWIKAAKAAKAVISSLKYELDPNYSDVFNNWNSPGLIWGRRRGSSNNFEKVNYPVGYPETVPGGTYPTQNLVDAYEIQATGKGIYQPGSGYDPSHPYEGRDPRFYKTILFNTAKWQGRRVEIWNGGKDAPPKRYATETGYYLKKYLIPSIVLEPGSSTEGIHTWVIYRYGGVLLMYAEAMNEAFGPYNPAKMGMSAWEAVNKIRERVEMPAFPRGMTKAEFRKKLRNERRVEMAFENQRFWDIRRWKIGPSTTNIEGMEIIKNPDDTFTYKRFQVEQRVWNKKMYYYPIPQDEIYINEKLNQNPKW